MTHILSVLRAAHCRSTHHYFALDALRNLKTAQAQRLANILLKYHDDYLVGAKAPDSNFKDFQNHVIHVSDGNWGGAPQKCQEWLNQTRLYLDKGKWKKAAYACGVLSHYFTDPIMPLHTTQHPREPLVHRSLEWSICQSYQQIYDLSQALGVECDFVLAMDDQWISKAVLSAAQVAHRHCDRLVDIYDEGQGSTNAREALNDEAMSILAELFALAIGGWSRVLTRLADETTKELPQVSLTVTSILATIDMPLAWIVRRISQAQEQQAVRSLLHEFAQTGRLKRRLPAEIAVVEHAKKTNPSLGRLASEQPAPARSRLEEAALDQSSLDQFQPPKGLGEQQGLDQQVAAISAPLSESQLVPSDSPSSSRNLPNQEPLDESLVATLAVSHDINIQLLGESPLSSEIQAKAIEGPAAVDSVDAAVDAIAKETLTQRHSSIDELVSTGLKLGSDSDEMENSAPREALVADQSLASQFISLSQARKQGLVQLNQPVSIATEAKQAHSSNTDVEIVDRSNGETTPLKKIRIAPGTILPVLEDNLSMVHYGSPLIQAPSIGPKTAKRFENIGITTIRQLVSSSPESIVQGLATRWITQNLVRDWQDQARLVCEVPSLVGYQAQLLVAVGCRTSWQLRTGNPDSLYPRICQFCQTSEGQQILLSARLPLAEDVASWIESARSFARRDVA